MITVWHFNYTLLLVTAVFFTCILHIVTFVISSGTDIEHKYTQIVVFMLLFKMLKTNTQHMKQAEQHASLTTRIRSATSDGEELIEI